MKQTLPKFIANFYSLTKNLFIFILFFGISSVMAQPPFDNRYGSILNADDGPVEDFVTCPSIDPDNYTYTGVQAIYYPKGLGYSVNYTIRGVRVKSDGTLSTANFDYIQTMNDYNIFPLKIITINGNTEYLITGYVTPHNGIDQAPFRPRPFVIKANASLQATMFKVFDHPEFFSDVDELSNNDLLFSGSMCYTTKQATAYRSGWIMRTDPTTFTASWMRFLHTTSMTSSHNFNIVHDAIVVNSDYAIICGSTNEQSNCVAEPNYYDPPVLDSFVSRAFIAKIDLSDGSFNWHKSLFNGYLGARLALNSAKTTVVLALNNSNTNRYPGLAFFNVTTGLLSLQRYFECSNSINGVSFNNGTSYSNTNILTHYPSVIQNIYFMNNDQDIFISGKFIDLIVTDNVSNTQIGTYDMPFKAKFDYTNKTYTDFLLFKTAQQFSGYKNFLSYDIWNPHDGECGNRYPPFYVASNTLPCLSGSCTDEYVTITADASTYDGTVKQDKVWIYSNDNQVCENEYVGLTTINENFSSTHIEIINDDIIVSPITDDWDYSNYTIYKVFHSCSQ